MINIMSYYESMENAVRENPLRSKDILLEIDWKNFSAEERRRLNIFMEKIAESFTFPDAHWHSESGVLTVGETDIYTPVEGPGNLRNAIIKMLLDIDADQTEYPPEIELEDELTQEITRQQSIASKVISWINPNYLKEQKNPLERLKRYGEEERLILLHWVASQAKNPDSSMAKISAQPQHEA